MKLREKFTCKDYGEVDLELFNFAWCYSQRGYMLTQIINCKIQISDAACDNGEKLKKDSMLQEWNKEEDKEIERQRGYNHAAVNETHSF
jgi:hypothetical protein